MTDENASVNAMAAAKANAEVKLIEAQTNKDQIELRKSEVDTALLNEQLEKLKRENRESQQRERTLSGRYWFVPSATHLFQPIGTGLILAGKKRDATLYWVSQWVENATPVQQYLPTNQ